MGADLSASLDQMQVNYCNLTEVKIDHARRVVAGQAQSVEDCAMLLEVLGLN